MSDARPYFPDISPKAYEHPADRAATAALASIPYIESFIKFLAEHRYERKLRQLYIGNSVRLGPNQLPRVYEMWQETLAALGMSPDIELYVIGTPDVNAMAIGAKKPIVVLNSSLVKSLNDKELRAVLAHEAAHILSGHVVYTTALIILLNFSLKSLPFFAKLPLRAILMALLEWSRAAELTCDRAAALVTGDPRVVCSVMMTFAGGIKSEEMNLDAFISQADTYETWENFFDRFNRFQVEVTMTHGFPVQRVTELMRWVQDGDWNRIMGGEYVRTSDPVSTRRETSQAVVHYTERFKRAFKTNADSITSTGKRAAERFKEEDPIGTAGRAASEVADASRRAGNWVKREDPIGTAGRVAEDVNVVSKHVRHEAADASKRAVEEAGVIGKRVADRFKSIVNEAREQRADHRRPATDAPTGEVVEGEVVDD